MLKPLKCFLLTINLTLKSLCSMSHRKAGVVEDYFEDLSQTLSFWGLCLLSEDTNETGVTDKGIHQKKRGALCQPRANNKRGLGESFLKQESGIVQLQGEHIQYDRGTGEGDSWDPKIWQDWSLRIRNSIKILQINYFCTQTSGFILKITQVYKNEPPFRALNTSRSCKVKIPMF